jgi:hypothetical protein
VAGSKGTSTAYARTIMKTKSRKLRRIDDIQELNVCYWLDAIVQSPINGYRVLRAVKFSVVNVCSIANDGQVDGPVRICHWYAL